MHAMNFRKQILLAFAILLALCPLAHASQNASYREMAEAILADISGGAELQKWLDGALTEGAGGSTDNYVINLRRAGYELDYSAYIRAASEKIQGEAIKNPVSRQRCALALIACGAGDQLPEDFVDETAGKLGVMSYVYGLHLLNNGAASKLWTAESIAESLISMQKADGGWAVMGSYSDVDVTSMCLHALAACDRTDEISAAIERALDMIGEKQLDNGGFSSMGRENSESCSQLLIALGSLGIDPQADARFIKNGASVLDALLEYKLPSGLFTHLPEDETANEMASMQAFQAFTALSLSGEPYFDFTRLPADAEEQFSLTWKHWAWIIIAVLTIGGVIYALTRRHGRAKQLLFVLAAAIVAAAAVGMINIESTSEYYRADFDDREAVGSVYFSIRCDSVAGIADDGSTPESGIILDRVSMPIHAGDTVFNVLTAAVRTHGIHMEYTGASESTAYVCGINHLYEYSHGELSGWLYTLNGETLSTGCGSCPVKDGDEIVWHFTINMGEDIQ